MLRFVITRVRERKTRSVALGAGILVSAVAFVLLIGSARSGELKVSGSVSSSFRPAYDVLVRPRRSATQLERSQGLVRDNYLSGIFGGITLSQWRGIEQMPGVAVAAPVANIGYTAAFARLPLSIDTYLTNAENQLFRLESSYVTPDGSHYPAGTAYVYVTRNGLFTADRTATGGPPAMQLDRGRSVNPCGGFMPPPALLTQPFQAELFPYIACFSTRTGKPEPLGGYPARFTAHVQSEIGAAFPIFLAAIDPVQEAKLLKLDKTVVTGRYLRSAETPATEFSTSPLTHQRYGYRYVPLLASAKTYVGDRLDTQVERLRVKGGINLPEALSSGSCQIAYIPCPDGKVNRPPPGSRYRTGLEFARKLNGSQVGRVDTGLPALYSQLLAGFAADQRAAVAADAYWTVSDVHYRRRPDGALVPSRVSNPDSVYVTAFSSAMPWDNKDVQFRRLSARPGDNRAGRDGVLNRPFLRVVGRFDPSRLPGFSSLSRVPLETYYPPLLTAADAASRKVMRGRPLSPTQNLGDYIQQPPLFLTTIASLPAFLNPDYFQGVPAAERRAPISAIRVRVAGVTGSDSRSIARIDSVALRIHEATGLQVDITAGSSPHPLTVALPAGNFGRPPLTLTEGWSQKGVSLAFLHGLDNKRVALFALIPLLCCVFLANGVFAAARARRSEIGVLMTLGWGREPIFKALFGEILLVGLVAGILGVAAAAALVNLLGLHASALTVALVLPVAVVLAAVSGLVPALRASAGQPLDALRPPVVGGRRGGNVGGLIDLALVNLRRVPGRTLIGAIGLAVGTCALTVLVAVEQAFNGVLAGTILGDAISVQIRSFDYLALGLVIGLAALSIADVLYLNLRERQAELVTLRTLGWRQRHLAQVVLAEAFTIGLGGSVFGAATGSAIGSAVLAAPLLPVLEGAAAALTGGIVAAAVASLLPLSQIGRLTPPSVLSAEQ